MTTVYFVRHATPNYQNHDDPSRELTAKGLEDRKLVTRFLWDKNISLLLSSPYRRAVDTIRDFADAKGMEIALVPDFRERKIGNGWIEDYSGFNRRQWEDFSYKLPDGESLQEVQDRNLRALRQVLAAHAGKSIAIGGHGTALSTVVHFFDPAFGYDKFNEYKDLMPWIAEFSFEGEQCRSIRHHNLFLN